MVVLECGFPDLGIGKPLIKEGWSKKALDNAKLIFEAIDF